jgi:16S rRNA (guanine966-N2)-methyltransferase
LEIRGDVDVTRIPNTLRIVGGRWRGRKLAFPPLESIRPTPDRVRETVFNWLQFDIDGARCLDLFAGSGALGFESLSRGAAHTVFVEREAKIGRYLRDTLAHLQAANAEVVVTDAVHWLQRAGSPFDVVFLDPPFASGILPEVCRRLEEG